MASVTITCSLAASDGLSSVGALKSSFTELDLFAGAQMYSHNPTASTTPAAISVGSITTSKDWRLRIHNKSTTSGEDIYISLDNNVTYPLMVPYGEVSLFNVLVGGVAVVFIKSNAGTPEYEITACEFEA